MKRWRLGAALMAAVVATATYASADTPPSVWERAKDPEMAEAFELHEAVQKRLVSTGSRDLDESELLRVLAMLERAQAEHSKSPLLRFDLAYVYEGLKNHARAGAIYKATIAEFPDHPAVERAWLRLAFACGHTGDHACERNAYIQVLRIETEEVYRATPTLNLAETQMHLGDLKDAIDGYREALRIAGRVDPTRTTAPLATWGLAVALDRSGDRVAAEKEARFAIEIERSMGMSPQRGNGLLRSADVFFVPAYEVNWYEGLGAIASARTATSSRDALMFWRSAERSFSEYVRQAEGKNDRWLPIAKARLAQVKAERERAEKATPREPPPELTPDAIRL